MLRPLYESPAALAQKSTIMVLTHNFFLHKEIPDILLTCNFLLHMLETIIAFKQASAF